MTQEANFCQSQPFVFPAILFIIGMSASHFAGVVIPLWGWLAALPAMALVALLLSKRPRWQSLALLVGMAVAGGLLMKYAENRPKTVLPLQETTCDAVLATEPEMHGKVIMGDLIITNKGQTMKVRYSLLRDTASQRWQSLHIGSGLRFSAFLIAPSQNTFLPDEYARWLERHDYTATTFIGPFDWQKRAANKMQIPRHTRAMIYLRGVRQTLINRYQHMGFDGQALGVAAAMTLGDRSYISPELRNIYSESGAAHVLALSGLHLGIIYFFLMILLPKKRWRFATRLLLVVVIWSYAWLVGLSASLCRSATLLTMMALGDVIFRGRQPINTLAATAVVLLIINPLSLLDVSFQLSFLAVLSILLFYPLFSQLLPASLTARSYMLRKVWSLLCTSASAMLLTTPLIAYYFHNLPVYSLLASLVAVPMATLIVGGGMFMLVSAFHTGLQQMVAHGVAWLSQALNNFLTWETQLPGACISNLNMSGLGLATCYLLLLMVWLTWHFAIEKMKVKW